MRVEIWSDVVCPWCYLGKRRFEKALHGFEEHEKVEVVWRSLQLDPSYPRGRRQPHSEYLATKLGRSPDQMRSMNEHLTALAAAEGLAYDFDSYIAVNTFDAHRLTQLARTHGLGAHMHERLLCAQLVEGQILEDADTLALLGEDVGLPAAEAHRVLVSDAYTADVGEDIRQARTLGIHGVPFFVIDRKYGISGAQQTDVSRRALQTAWDQAA